MATVLSVMMLVALALLGGAWVLWRKRGAAKQATLMLVSAAVMIVNVLIWTIPDDSGTALVRFDGGAVSTSGNDAHGVLAQGQGNRVDLSAPTGGHVRVEAELKPDSPPVRVQLRNPFTGMQTQEALLDAQTGFRHDFDVSCGTWVVHLRSAKAGVESMGTLRAVALSPQN